MKRIVVRVERWGPWFAAVAAGIGILLLTLSVAYTFHQQHQVTEQNRQRIAENAKTAMRLCEAAAGARDFWISVRASTREMLTDPKISPTAKRANEEFIVALDKVIRAANGIAHGCDGDR